VETCIDWATETTQECVSWAEETSQECCDWWPCSWACAIVLVIVSWVCELFAIVTITVCIAFGVVVTLVCVAFTIVVTIGCAIWAVLVYVFCLLWTVIPISFCLSNARGGTAFLLTDGTVMMQEVLTGLNVLTNRWWKLTPDENGSYANGSWSRLADSNVGRKYFASAVLADGRVLICGGEYSNASGSDQQDETNTCEIYDPTTDSWSTLSAPMTADLPPVTWSQIGDAPCALLPDGTFLMGSNETSDVAKLDPSTLTWTAMSKRPTVSRSSEESWVLMPDSTIASPSCVDPPTTWVYDVSGDQWNEGNDLPTSIVLPPPGDVAEIGPGLLRYDGTAFFLGGNQHTAIYSPAARLKWMNGGDLPDQDGRSLGVMDGPAAVLPNGNILFGAGPIDARGDYKSPCFYFEFDGSAFNRTNDPSNNNCPTYVTRLLLLPNGDVMFIREDDTSLYAYHSDAATPQDSFRPVIKNCPPNLVAGTTVQISGLQFNGLSQAVAYGDDAQTATNYPLVRVTNKGNHQVRYCRTFNHTTVDGAGNLIPSMGVATRSAVITTNAAIPGDLAAGDYTLEVVANGIPSSPFDVTVSSG
jgi:Kelch motif